MIGEFYRRWRNFVVDALIDFKPAYRFENWRDMVESTGSRDSSSGRVENKLKMIKLRSREIKRKRVIVILPSINQRCSNSLSSSIGKSSSDSSKITTSSATKCRHI